MAGTPRNDQESCGLHFLICKMIRLNKITARVPSSSKMLEYSNQNTSEKIHIETGTLLHLGTSLPFLCCAPSVNCWVTHLVRGLTLPVASPYLNTGYCREVPCPWRSQALSFTSLSLLSLKYYVGSCQIRVLFAWLLDGFVDWMCSPKFICWSPNPQHGNGASKEVIQVKWILKAGAPIR